MKHSVLFIVYPDFILKYEMNLTVSLQTLLKMILKKACSVEKIWLLKPILYSHFISKSKLQGLSIVAYFMC
jgi:hypothetical protein